MNENDKKSIINFNLDDHFMVLNQNTQNYGTLLRIEHIDGSGVFSKRSLVRVNNAPNRLAPRIDPVFVNAYKPHFFEVSHWPDGGNDWFLFFQEKIQENGDTPLFAFFSKDNIKEWFSDEELRSFHAAGFRLTILEVMQSWASDHQAIFLKSQIYNTKQVDLLSYLNIT